MLAPGAFENPRAKLVIGDGFEHVSKQVLDDSLDVVIMDLVDPAVGVNEFPMYSSAFFALLATKVNR